MTYEELENKAYSVATGMCLIESLSFQEFQEISDEELMDLAWEPLENLQAREIIRVITLAADDIIYKFEETLDGNTANP